MSQGREMFGISVVCTMTLCVCLEKITEWPHFSHFITVTDGDAEASLWSHRRTPRSL